jgi:large subunit ribosomal protein L9
MKVILLQDIENLGKKYEVKEVKAGYARNLLIPQGLAKAATKKALEWLEDKKETEAQKAEEELKEIQSLASAIDGQEIIIPVKIGEEGQLFESITVQRILDELKKLGFGVKKSQIELPQPIKELGEFPVKIKFEHNLEGDIKIIVVEEKETK